jgi:hypothetical protein
LLVFLPKISPEDADVGVFHQHLQISLAPTCSKNFCQSAYPFTTCFVLYQNYVFYGYTKPQAGIARLDGVGYGWWRHKPWLGWELHEQWKTFVDAGITPSNLHEG